MPPPLLAVSLALNAPFQALPHVLHLVNSFLIPVTIDSAVFHRLQRVIHVFGGSRPHTVGAMDGAAARGQLDVVQWLHSTRSEGCSSTAFSRAAANGHIAVLHWLYEFFPQKADPAQEIVKAAENGNVPVLSFLLPKVRREQVEPALEAAAANGHVAVLEALLQRPYSMQKSFLAAAANGQAQVVQFLLDSGYNDKHVYVNAALVAAAERGHCGVVGLLVDLSDDYTISDVLEIAATDGREDLVRFLLGRCRLEKLKVARALEKAAEKDRCGVVKLLVDEFTREEQAPRSSARSLRSENSIIDFAFMSAVEKGHIGIVRLLIDIVSRPISDALLAASYCSELEVLEFIIDYCEAHNLKDFDYQESITSTVEAAAGSHRIDVVTLVVAKCDILSTRGALKIAVVNDDLEMLRVLLAKSNLVSIEGALVQAAVINRVEMLESLLEHSSADMIEQALIRAETLGNSKMSKLLLGRCSVAAYSRIFDNAAEHGLIELVELLLDNISSHSIRCALISAAINGHAEVVEVLMDKSDSMGITCAFEMAVLRSQIGVIRLLRSRCDADSIQFAISAGGADVVQVLRNKRPRLG